MAVKKITKKKLSKKTTAETAIKIVIMDALSKGHTNKNELIAYMKTATFKNSVKSYMKLIKSKI